MARTLPWMKAVGVYHRTTTTTSTTNGQRTTKRPRQEITVGKTGVTEPSRQRQAKRRSSRTPSTSPPPMPPLQEPMRPSDNAWIMVEDELYAVAQSYTKHLHWTEYKRLKDLAAERRTKIAIIDRPMDGRMPLSKELKPVEKHEDKRQETAYAPHAAEAKNPNQTLGVEESENEEDVVIGDKNLAGLMLGIGVREKTRRAISRGTIKSTNTRAAAGFEKQQYRKSKHDFSTRLYDIPSVKAEQAVGTGVASEQESLKHSFDLHDDDEDDLDLPMVRKSKISFVTSASANSSIATAHTAITPYLVNVVTNHHVEKEIEFRGNISTVTSRTHNLPLAKPRKEFASETFNFDGLPRPRPLSSHILERVKARTLTKHPRDEKGIKLEEIPTFMI